VEQQVVAWQADLPAGTQDLPIWSEEPTEALVARLLGGSRTARQRSAQLVQAAGTLRSLGRVSQSSPLLTPDERARLLAGLELGRRALCERTQGQRIHGPEAIVARYRDLALAEVEVLIATGLDSAGRVLAEQRFAGTVDRVHAQPRDVLRTVIAAGAVGLVLVHNHPSGWPTPSAGDIAFSRRVRQAAILCGIQLVDHVILAGGRWVSMRALGHLDDRDAEEP
jgi:DNA repair protein RadC